MTFVFLAVWALTLAPSATAVEHVAAETEAPREMYDPTGLQKTVTDASDETGVYKVPYWFDEHGLTGTWWCHQLEVAGNDVPAYGDPESLALCEQWSDEHVICYIIWVDGEWDGRFLCMYY